MRIYLVSAFLLFVSSFGFSQDIIVKKDGKKIEAKVLEISATKIIFKRADQKDGPLRTLPVYEISEIMYQNGSREIFDQEQPVQIASDKIRNPRAIKTKYPFDSGIFIDLILGYSGTNVATTNSNFYGQYDPSTGTFSKVVIYHIECLSLNFRFGNKFYLRNKENMWRPGIQANWIRWGFNLSLSTFPLHRIHNISLANVGMANIFRFTDEIGLEVNFTAGFNLDYRSKNLTNGDAVYGLGFSPELKFRYKNMAIGFDYLRIEGFIANNQKYTRNWNVLGLSVGAKF